MQIYIYINKTHLEQNLILKYMFCILSLNGIIRYVPILTFLLRLGLLGGLLPSAFPTKTIYALNNPIFWYIMLCSPLKVNRRFGGTYRIHLLGRRVKNQSAALKMKAVSSPVTSTSARIYSDTSQDTVLAIKTHPSFDRVKCFLLLIGRTYQLGTTSLYGPCRLNFLLHRETVTCSSIYELQRYFVFHTARA
jgi:hypothetical protein